MAWVKTTRITLLVGLLVAGAALAWLAAHPKLYAGHLARLVTRNLLQDVDASLTFEDMRGNPLERLVFYDVTFVRDGDGADLQYVNADSMTVAYDIRTLMRREPILRELEIAGARALIRLSESDPDSDPDTPHPWTTIESLPKLDVGRLRLDGVDIEFVRADGSTLQEARGIFADVGLRSDGTVIDGTVYGIQGSWTTQGLRIREGGGVVRFEPPFITCDPFHVALDTTVATVDLMIGFAPDGQAIVECGGVTEDFVLDEVMRLILQDPSEVPRLRLAGEGRVSYRDEILRIRGSGEGWLDAVPVTAREFSARLEGDDFVFEHMDGSYWSADGTASGVLRTDLDPAVLELTGSVDGVDLSDPWAGEDLGWPESSLHAEADVRLEISGESVAIAIQAEGLRGEVAGLPVADGRIDLGYDEVAGLDVTDAVVFSQGARLEVRGTVGADEIVDLFVQAEADSIDAWAREIELPVTGRTLVGAGRLSGPIDRLELEAAGTISTVQWERTEAERGKFSVRIPRVDDPERLNGRLEAPRFTLAGNELGKLEVALEREGAVNRIPVFRLSVPDSSVELTGRIIEQEATADFRIEVDSLQADLGGELWVLADPAALVVGETGFATEGVTLRSATGRFRLAGEADEQGVLDLELDVEDGDLSILDRVGLVEDIGGGVAGGFRLTGTSAYPVVDLRFEVEDFSMAEREVEQVVIAGRSEGRSVQMETLEIVTDAGSADGEGSIRLPFDDWLARLRERPEEINTLWSDATIDVAVGSSDLDLERWLDPGSDGGAYGRIDGEVRASGSTREPTLTGRVVMLDFPAEPFVLPRMQADFVAGPQGLEITEGFVDLGGPDARVTASLPLYVSLVGPSRFEPGEDLRAELDTGDIELSTLKALWSQVRSIDGRGRLVLRASGSFEDPDLNGSLTIRDGAFALEGWAEDVREVEVDGEFADQTLLIRRVEAREGLNGRIVGSGQVPFVDFLPDDIALDLRADRVLIASVPFLRAIGSSDDMRLTIERPAEGSPRAPKISGTVTVDKAIYTGEFVEAGAEPDPTLMPTSAPLWLADLRIRAQDQVRISNQSAELRVAGDVTLVRDTGGLRIRGDVQIPQGRVPLFNNDFTITEGSLDFSRRPVEPEVDITAETEVPIYDPSGSFGRELERITVHLTGTFAEPTVRFESESGLDETAILRLLAGFGSTGDTVAPAGLGDVGIRAGLNFLERALAQQIQGVDTIDIETEEAGLNEMQSTRIAVGKYLSSSLYLRFSQGLSVTERDLFLEYQMTRRLLFTSELRRRLRESGAENEFNLDLRFRVKY